MKVFKNGILGLETTTNICSVVLSCQGEIIQRVTEKARSHSKTILPMVAEVLAEAQMSMSDIEAIACTQGPGSFTGVRIGIGVAKGLAYGQDIPIYPVSPLATIAYQALQENPHEEKVLAMMDARMGELYVGEYEKSPIANDEVEGLFIPQIIGSEQLTSLSKITVENQFCAGTGVEAYHSELLQAKAKLSEVYFPYAKTVIELAQLDDIQTVTAETFKPVYLRNKVTY